VVDDAVALTREQYESYKQRFNNWGRWGDGDQLGTLNHITADMRRRAASLVRTGRTVSLARPLATERVLPGHRNQRPADHRVETGDFGCGDYVGVSYHGFANTHIDGLCHIFTADGRMYGGRPKSDVTADGALNNSVDHWRAGIVTRGVLYDVVRHRGAPHVTFDQPVHDAELEEIAKAEGVTPQPGDAVVVRMGAAAFWAANPDHQPASTAPGLHASALEFLSKHDAALLCWDLMEAPGQDALGAPAFPIHSIAIPYMGMPLLDNADLEDIAAASAEEGRWEFMLTVAPLVVIGGTGSPVNPIAVL
jgi:kynurenine formamidase